MGLCATVSEKELTLWEFSRDGAFVNGTPSWTLSDGSIERIDKITVEQNTNRVRMFSGFGSRQINCAVHVTSDPYMLEL